MGEVRPTRRDLPRGTTPTRRDAVAGVSVTRRDEPTVAARSAPDGDDGGLPEPVFIEYEPVKALRPGGEAHRVMKVRHRTKNTLHVVKVYGEVSRPDTGLLAALHAGNDENQAHLVRVDGWGEDEDRYGAVESWEILEYVPGGSLRDLVAAEGPALAEDLVRRVLAELTDALDHLHKAVRYQGSTGVAHRDVKPENVLVRTRDPLDLVLCDFGLVAEIRATRMTSRRAGTAEYQAPETWHTASRDAAQDWWSLGVLIVELLTGRNPNAAALGARSDDRTLFTHLTSYGVDLSDVTDARWHMLCAGLLTFAPHHRWGANEVREWLAGRSPLVHSRHTAPEREPVAAPIEVAGRLCHDLTEVATAFHGNWRAAIRQFTNRDLRLALSDWLDDNFADVTLPRDLFRTDPADATRAGERVVRFLSLVAPGLPPVFAGRAMDAVGIVAVTEQAMAGDATASAVLTWLDGEWLAVFARYACRLHPECASSVGCERLRVAATRIDQCREQLADRAEQLGRVLGTPLDANVRADAAATLVQVLVEPTAAQALLLRLQKESWSAGWWRQLLGDATRTAGDRGLVALVLAGATTGRARDEVAAAAAQARKDKREAWDQRVEWAREALATVRRGTVRVGRDVVAWVLALATAYLATFFGLLIVAGIREPMADPAILAAAITGLQTAISLPVAILLACTVIRSRMPLSAGARALQVVLGAGVAAAAATGFYRSELLGFPVWWETGVRDGLGAVNDMLVGGPDTLVATLAIVGVLWLVLANRLVAVTRGAERSGSAAVLTAKRAVVGVFVVVLALRTGVLLFGWRLPAALPDLTTLWFTI